MSDRGTNPKGISHGPANEGTPRTASAEDTYRGVGGMPIGRVSWQPSVGGESVDRHAGRWRADSGDPGKEPKSGDQLGAAFASIAPDVKLGKNVKLGRFINLYGCEVGDESKIGAFVEIQKNARVGRRCKISSHTFICEGVTIEDQVFIGHSVTFINDSHPRATTPSGKLQTEEDWTVEITLVKKGASIGSGTTILSNVVIGENAIVGAGSVVTRNVPANTIVAGNPAKILRRLAIEPEEGI